MRANLSHVVVAMVSAGLIGCGGGSGPSGAAADTDAGAEGGNAVTNPVEAGAPMEAAPPPVDHGAPSSTYPAFPVSVGQLQDNGGPKLKAPVIVPITWNSDPTQAGFDTFADELGATSYWKTAVGEWGVGPATSGAANHVHMTTAAPATLTESQTTSDFQTMITTNAGVAGTGWPAATPETIYAFFLPPGTSLLMDSGFGGGGPADACSQGVGGYHMAATTTGNVTAAYAVVPSCNFGGGNTAAQQSTMSMSHELGEAATDPYGQNPGVIGFDNFAYTYFQSFSEENGDACEFFVYGQDSSFYEEKETSPAPFDYWVQRLWSNKSAAAGHNPCIPAPADPYFNVTPLGMQNVNVSLPSQLTGSSSAQNQPTKGYKVLAGSSGKFAVGFFSDAPTSGPWTIKVTTGNPLGGGGIDSYNKSSLAMKVDKTSGTNGEKAWIDVTVTTSGALFKGELITVTSTLNGVSHYQPIWIAGQ